uniref:Uncharacterized protein n=1 Tax=Nicotiana tabacum TaxID=4097 RepID=A0A1S3YUC3_TOBAC
MVRTRTTGSDDQTPMHPVGSARGRGRGRAKGRGRPHGAARAPARAAAAEPQVAPVRERAPETPVTTPALQETLAQVLSMFGTLAQAGLIPLVLATSQAVRGAQTPAAPTPEPHAQVANAPDAIPVQPEVRAAVLEGEQLRLERYKKYRPPTFS